MLLLLLLLFVIGCLGVVSDSSKVSFVVPCVDVSLKRSKRGDAITWGDRSWSHDGGEFGDGRRLAQFRSLADDVLAVVMTPCIRRRN